MTKQELFDLLEAENCLLADGYQDALIGIGYQFTNAVAVYDRNKVLEILMADGLDYTDALEWFEFNIQGAYVGEKTPVFIELATED